MNFFNIHAILFGKVPFEIGVQLFTDAFGHETHRPYFLDDSVNTAFFKFCAK